MTHILRILAACAVAAAASNAAHAVDGTNDFPTLDRVVYVHDCMRASPGPTYEMMSKCSCALDALANEISFDDYTTMSTATNAVSIGGERGGTLRDNDSIKASVKRFKEIQARVKKGCFINTP